MRRFWIEFDRSLELPPGVALGCGVTARDYEDALALVGARVFPGRTMPEPVRTVADVDISELDQNHVIPNMEDPVKRGIWFPRGYS